MDDEGRPTYRPTMAKPNVFHLDLSSPDPSSRAVADALALAVFDDPPPWVRPDWKTVFSVTYVPTPRSKARGSSTTNPNRQRVLAAMAKPRPGEVISTGVNYLPPAGDWTFTGTSYSRRFSFHVTAHEVTEVGLADPQFGPWALRAVARALSLGPSCTPCAAWFGGYSAHPYAYGPHTPDQLPGYGWAVTLPPTLTARLGGARAVERSPAALRTVVATPDGDVTVLVLTHAPNEVDADLLREWKRFLSPVLADNRLSVRTEDFVEARATHPWQFDLPPMMLAEDWPAAPTPSA